MTAHAGIVVTEGPRLQPLARPDPAPSWAALRADPRTPAPVAILDPLDLFRDASSQPIPPALWSAPWSNRAGPPPGEHARFSAPGWREVDPFTAARAPVPVARAPIAAQPALGPADNESHARHTDLDARFGHALLLARVAPLPSPGVPAAATVAALALSRRRRSKPGPGV